MSHRFVGKGYLLPFMLITFFFFLWGFARATLDVLNPFFQQSLGLTKVQASAVQFVTYLAYFIMAVPAGNFIRSHGTRRGVLLGLSLFGLGAIGFCLKGWFEGLAVFALFLSMLFIIGVGLATLEVAANPYVTLLGDAETAASRINRAQAFNGLGCICGSLLTGLYCFSSDNPDISLPYIVVGITVLIIAVIFSRVKLPEFEMEPVGAEFSENKTTHDRLLNHPLFFFGLFALFCYEVSEISINSFFINYAAENDLTGWMVRHLEGLNHQLVASMALSVGLLLFMLGRFAGSWIMQFVKAEQALVWAAIMAVVCTGLIIIDIPYISFAASLCVFVCESIMFPTIFALCIRGLGPLTQRASSVLMMTPIGGAVGTVLMGATADAGGMTIAFIVPLIAFTIVLGYAWLVRLTGES